MQNMLMGRYIPGDSIIHRMDPRSKTFGDDCFCCHYLFGS